MADLEVGTLPTLSLQTVKADDKPADTFDYAAWAEAIPAVVALDNGVPKMLDDAGTIINKGCARNGFDEKQRCWGRVTSLDHPVSTTAESLHTCRGHFWQLANGGPFVPLPQKFAAKK